MIAIARLYDLEILHASTNAAPRGASEEWYSHDCADSILVARKKYHGKQRR